MYSKITIRLQGLFMKNSKFIYEHSNMYINQLVSTILIGWDNF